MSSLPFRPDRPPLRDRRVLRCASPARLFRAHLCALGILAALLVAGSSHAQKAPAAAMLRQHALSGELGGFLAAENSSGRVGVGVGAGYAFRVLEGLELGVGLRYRVLPTHETDIMYAPSASEPNAPPEYFVEPEIRLWFAGLSVRGFVPLDRKDNVELGLTARAGLLVLSNKKGLCCSEYSVAPDVRVRLAERTSLQFAPEVALATNPEQDPNKYEYHDLPFFVFSAWLSVVQRF
jgi:hypothetical protein